MLLKMLNYKNKFMKKRHNEEYICAAKKGDLKRLQFLYNKNGQDWLTKSYSICAEAAINGH